MGQERTMSGSERTAGKSRRTNVFFYAEDDAAIAAIKHRYGVSTDSDAVRLALRVLAQGKLMLLADGADDLHGLHLDEVHLTRRA